MCGASKLLFDLGQLVLLRQSIYCLLEMNMSSLWYPLFYSPSNIMLKAILHMT